MSLAPVQALALAVALTLAAACAPDDDGLGPTPLLPEADVARAPDVTPDAAEEPELPPRAPDRLTYAPGQLDASGAPCTTTCFIRAPAGTRVTLSVRHSDAANAPLVERAIRFDAGDAPTGFLTLGAFSAYTDPAGLASVEVRSHGLAGSATITAAVGGSAGADIQPLTFVITFEAAPLPDLSIAFQHFGLATVQGFTLRGWLLGPDASPGCPAVYPDAPPTRDPDLEAGPFSAGTPAVVQTLPGLADAGTQRWTFRITGDGPTGPLASGCADAVVTTAGTTTSFALPVLDLPLNFRSTQAIETRVDVLSGGTGTPIGDVLATLADLFTSPGGLLVRWACGGDPGGTLGTVCGWLLNDSGSLSVAGAVIAGYADGALLELLADNFGSNNQVAARIVSELLRDLRFTSELAFAAEPATPLAGFDGARFAPSDVLETWIAIRFRWKFDPSCKTSPDPNDCGWTSIPMEEIYGHRPTAEPPVGVDMARALHVDRHTVSDLTFGPLISAILERRILALLFEAEGLRPVASWDDLVGVLLGDRECLDYGDCCDIFAERIYDDVPYAVYLLAPTACEAAVPVIANVIRGRFAALDGALSLGTPADAPCASVDNDSDRWVDGYGTSFAPCAWDMDFATDSGPYSMTNSWRAIVR
jgi:hypothetical protein